MKESYASIGRVRIRYLESDINNSGVVSISPSSYDVTKKTTFTATSTAAVGQLSKSRKQQHQLPQQKQQHVLFIHGLGSSADRWLDIPDAMSLLGFHAVAIDLPGFGKSDKPLGMHYTIEEFVKTIKDFMCKIGIDDGKTSIVGHSLGGYIAAQLAAEWPALVNKLVLVDSSGILKGPTPLLSQYLEAAMALSKELVQRVFEQLVANPTRIPDILVDAFIYRMQQPNAKHAFKSAYDNSTTTQIGSHRLKLISDNNVPTMIVWGKQDRLIPLKYCQAFKEAIRNSHTVVINDAGHAPFAEKPAIFCDLLHEFLQPSTNKK